LVYIGEKDDKIQGSGLRAKADKQNLKTGRFAGLQFPVT
jgi:hypothetical protein